jgi:hypothetical protein
MTKLPSILLVTLAACAAEPETLAEGPPFVDDSELLGDGKADGGPALGASKVVGQQSGYRSDDADFSCTPGGKIGFDIEYVNKSLPWGVTLDLWRGMYVEEWCGGCEPAYDITIDWADHQVVRMKPTSAWGWSAHTESYGYGAGAGGQFLAMRYVVRITMPDGSIRWDNGGSNWGYYQVLAPEPKCDAAWTPWVTNDSPLQSLPVVAVPKY